MTSVTSVPVFITARDGGRGLKLNSGTSLWYSPVNTLSCPHAHAVLNHETHAQDVRNQHCRVWVQRNKRKTGFWSARWCYFGLLWQLLTLLQMARILVFSHLASMFCYFFFFLLLHRNRETEFQELKSIRGRKVVTTWQPGWRKAAPLSDASAPSSSSSSGEPQNRSCLPGHGVGGPQNKSKHFSLPKAASKAPALCFIVFFLTLNITVLLIGKIFPSD